VTESEHYSTRPGGGETFDRISPGLGTASLGGFALVLATVSFFSSFYLLAWIDIIINVPIFFICAWVALEGKGKGFSALPGLLLSLAGVTVSLGHLIFTTTHPWLS